MINLSHYSQHDLTTLQAVAELGQVGNDPHRAHEAAAISGLDIEATHRALARLLSAGYIRATETHSNDSTYRCIDPILGLTEKGLRLSGAWPSGDHVVDHIVAALEDAAGNAATQDEAAKLRAAARGLARTGRDIAAAAAAAVVAGRI